MDMTDRLFDLDLVPEVPLFREPRARKGAARGAALDARFANDYPPEWDRCPTCDGSGRAWGERMERADGAPDGEVVQVEFEAGASRFVMTAYRGLHDGEAPLFAVDVGTYVGFRRRDKVCSDCFGMGSVKAMVRLLAGHRCERCHHPYIPKGDALRLGVERSGMHDGVWTPWSACNEHCKHKGPLRYEHPGEGWREVNDTPSTAGQWIVGDGGEGDGLDVEAAWRILTVHHLDGDKANLAWWNLAALCQRCHLEIQAKVVMERVYPHEHSPWFQVHAAGYYAKVYLGEDLSLAETLVRIDELLALERVA